MEHVDELSPCEQLSCVIVADCLLVASAADAFTMNVLITISESNYRLASPISPGLAFQ